MRYLLPLFLFVLYPFLTIGQSIDNKDVIKPHIVDTVVGKQVNIGCNRPLIFLERQGYWKSQFYFFQLGLKREKAKYTIRNSFDFSFYQKNKVVRTHSAMFSIGLEKGFSKKKNILQPYFGGDLMAFAYRDYFKVTGVETEDTEIGLGITAALGLEVLISKVFSLSSEISISGGYSKVHQRHTGGLPYDNTYYGFGIMMYRGLSLSVNYNF